MSKKKMIALGWLLACVGVSSILAQDTGSKPQEKGGMEKGAKDEGKIEKSAAKTKAPDFTLTDTEGKQHKLADLADKIVVLEWTNKGCPYVVRHVKEQTMKKLATEYGQKGVVWMAIDSTASAVGADVEAWREANAITYPVLLDPTGMVGRAFDAKTTPHIFVVRNGAILYSGAIDDNARGNVEEPTNYVRKALDEILAGKAVTTPHVTPYGCSIKFGPGKDAN